VGRRATNWKGKTWDMADCDVLMAYGDAEDILNSGGKVVSVPKHGVARSIGGKVLNIAQNEREEEFPPEEKRFL
jgi:hypothetical protein